MSLLMACRPAAASTVSAGPADAALEALTGSAAAAASKANRVATLKTLALTTLRTTMSLGPRRPGLRYLRPISPYRRSIRDNACMGTLSQERVGTA
jgi:hypothetical protein